MSQEAPLIPPHEQSRRSGASSSKSRRESETDDDEATNGLCCWGVLTPTPWYKNGSPARVRALGELQAAYVAVQRDVAKLDGRCRVLYKRFFAHIRDGHDPELDYFKSALKWYKQNRDEMHETITELLVLFADAQSNGETFPINWDPMPERIRSKRRRWKQVFKPEFIAERHVVEAFTMPKPLRENDPIDAETDVESRD
jgi:hypothetical protein